MSNIIIPDELPLYKHYESCPKCGHSFTDRAKPGVSKSYVDTHDVLTWICQECKYRWRTKTKDKTIEIESAAIVTGEQQQSSNQERSLDCDAVIQILNHYKHRGLTWYVHLGVMADEYSCSGYDRILGPCSIVQGPRRTWFAHAKTGVGYITTLTELESTLVAKEYLRVLGDVHRRQSL